MADDKKAPDEYQYPPEEYYKGGEYLPDENIEPIEPEEPVARRTVPRRLFWVLGFLGAIALVYLILSYINAQSGTDLSQQAPIAAAVPTAAPVAAVQPTPAPQPITVDNPTMDANVQRLQMQNQANQQTIANLQSQVQQMQSQMSDLTNSLSALTNQIQVLANELKAIATDRLLQGRDLSVSSGPVYHVKAMVPGRAWIQTRDRNLTSVSIGDRLPGYGIIQMINTDQGIVTTSSGAIIHYGPKDK